MYHLVFRFQSAYNTLIFEVKSLKKWEFWCPLWVILQDPQTQYSVEKMPPLASGPLSTTGVTEEMLLASCVPSPSNMELD